MEPGQEFRVLRQSLKSKLIVLLANALQCGIRRRPVERGNQGRRRAEIELTVAPLQLTQRIEVMVLDRLDRLGVESPDIDRRAEGPVVHVAPGAPGDLRQLDVAQRTRSA